MGIRERIFIRKTQKGVPEAQEQVTDTVDSLLFCRIGRTHIGGHNEEIHREPEECMRTLSSPA